MSDEPRILESKNIYRGRKFSVSIDKVVEREKVRDREVVLHHGSAAIVAVDEDDMIALVRQYRHPMGKHLLEIPAGSLEHDEGPEQTAARELQEEVGLIAHRLEVLCEFYVSPGFLQEKMWVYLASELTETTQQLENDEIVEVVRIPFSKALEMITTGEIEDAKTIIGLMLAAPRLGPSMLEVEYPAV